MQAAGGWDNFQLWGLDKTIEKNLALIFLLYLQHPGGADDSAVGVLAPVVGHLPDL